MEISARLAEFVAGTVPGRIPAAARAEAKWAILDTLGVMLAGSREEVSGLVARWVRDAGGSPETTVAGWGFRAPATEAAMVNGVSAHALDYDDVSISMRGHPSAPLVPAVLALAEKLGSPGTEVIDAYVLGFEVQARLGRAIGEEHYALGWHATSTFGTIGAAAACARLLHLDADRTQAALGIAASLASGIQQNFGSMTKPLHAGWAARSGLVAASLAAAGLTADRTPLEGPRGFVRVMSGGQAPDVAALMEHLGEEWDITTAGIGVKLYPCCYATHRAVDAALEIRQSYPLTPGDVRELHVVVSPGTLLPLVRRQPQTGLEGKFSLGYCLAAALLDGAVTLDSFSDAAVRRPEARRLMDLVRVEEGGPPAQFPIGGSAEVRVITIAGAEHRARVEIPRGDPRRPLTREERVAKFRQCAIRACPSDRAESVIAMVEDLDGLADAGRVARLLA